ncbi:hypothetical protein BDB00DRAFT_883829 [Zychaea mexicana]|uniref:uncharacterized protein n=1 Tax=Zychaea mexicana TaxID=64656 RepID=UPI0022FE24B2|nr:uncharacterized protein BDB00DRAFT_883829 [Zychaea mexicana]KAI9491449.1 hypothetical protein BDB00DRAFT_883829 [Zychaea mexicana]
MYSPTQQQFNTETQDHHYHSASAVGIHNNDPNNNNNNGAGGSLHTTVGAVPVRNNPAYNTSSSSYSFGAASLAMSPTSTTAGGGRGIPFGEANSHHWFGTSMDSVGSSFGQSPPIFGGAGGRGDLIVSPSTSTSQLDGLTAGEEDETQQRNLQEIFEKRRRRRESHNAVERRRRDNINERIHETAPTSSNVMSVSTNQAGANARAINKGTILRLSVDHIKELQVEVTRYQEKIKELEDKIDDLKSGPGAVGQQQHSNAASGNDFTDERTSSIQFQQQFGNLHITPNDMTRQP